jgi:hypothetical protein
MTARSDAAAGLGFTGVSQFSRTSAQLHFERVSEGEDSFKNAKKGLDKISLVIVP